MCGIAGYYAKQGAIPDFRKSVLNTLQARGPDGEGYFEHSKARLFHTRLGIISLGEEGKQPFSLQNGRHWISFNGEILNFLELKASLSLKGISFQTQTDTEVLLQGLVTEGISFLNKVRGFFAFAWYDTVLEKLVLGRDHAGIKPLMWAENAQGIYFGSHSQAILKMGFEAKPDRASLSAFLEFHFIPPERSMWQNLQPLLPGHVLEIQDQSSKIFLWGAAPDNTFHSESSFEDQLKRSVLRNLVADVPAGIFLSGGLDSTLLAGCVQAYSQTPLTAFTLSFKNQWLNEAKTAAARANQYHWKWIPVELQPDTAIRWLDRMPEPIGDPAGIGIFRLSEVAAKEVKFVLSGDGADELLGGYSRYKAWKWAQNFQIPGFPLPNFQNRESMGGDLLRKTIRMIKLLQTSNNHKYRMLSGFRDEMIIPKMLLNQEEYHFAEVFNAPKEYDLITLLKADRQFLLPGNMLPKTDHAGMTCGLEIRVPYLDEDLVDWVNRHPESILLGKKLLHETWLKISGETFSTRKKGLDIPLSQLFQGELLERWKTYSNPTFLRNQGIFSAKEIHNPGTEKMSWEQAWAFIVWQECWHKTQ
jgi:asparagine synthase (glutamine-hydrolysing)